MNKSILECPICKSDDCRKNHLCRDMVIYRCGSCGMMFQNPSDNLVVSNAYAAEMIDKDQSREGIHFSISRTTMGRILSVIHKPIGSLRVLEIGAGAGCLASRFVESGVEYTGVEPSKELYRQIIAGKPYLEKRVLNGHIDAVPLPQKKYDLLVMIDTLEHIPNPVEYLRKLKSFLSNDGVMYIEVPNEALLSLKGAMRRVLNVYSGYITHPGHVNLFNANTLHMALSGAGYRAISVSQYSVFGDYNRMQVALKGRWAAGCKIACTIFKYSKIDLLMQQGNLSACAKCG